MTEEKKQSAYIPLKGVCEYLGVSKSTVYKLINPELTKPEDILPSYRIGGDLRFKRSEIEQWMQRHKNQAS